MSLRQNDKDFALNTDRPVSLGFSNQVWQVLCFCVNIHQVSADDNACPALFPDLAIDLAGVFAK